MQVRRGNQEDFDKAFATLESLQQQLDLYLKEQQQKLNVAIKYTTNKRGSCMLEINAKALASIKAQIPKEYRAVETLKVINSSPTFMLNCTFRVVHASQLLSPRN